MKLKDTFLYKGSRRPKAGEVTYWPEYTYMTAPTTEKTIISAMVQAQRDLGKSLETIH